MLQRKSAIKEISAEELKSKLDNGERITLIDVREMDEYKICHLEQAKLILLRQLPKHLNEIDKNQLTILYCHHGMRSAQAVMWLNQNGFANVVSLRGGIDEWAQKIEPEMERY